MFQDTSVGIVVIIIVSLSYLSNTLNWRYLNYGIIRFLYYIGAFVHEMSHAILCVFMGARIEKFTFLSTEPQVIHQKSKVPFIGEALISFAPIVGGLLFLFLINRYPLNNYFMFSTPLKLLEQINIFEWQSWVMILIFFNVGAMLGPSIQDLKNAWIIFIVLFFIKSAFLTSIGLVAINLIIVNIILQIFNIAILKLFSLLFRMARAQT